VTLRQRIAALYTERGCAHGQQSAIARELGVSRNTVSLAINPRLARLTNDRNKARYRKRREAVQERLCSKCGDDDHNKRRCPRSA
jgi:hypothetical protein